LKEFEEREMVRSVEAFKLIFELPKYKAKLRFKYSESVAESGEVGVAE
jgi:hypothetical protein